jgi:succinate-semialdehyde dehydrogenase/glutarate-semialdehyde dehydrogenase
VEIIAELMIKETGKVEEKAIKRTNDSLWGLAFYFFKNDGSRMFRIAEALEYGIVGINEVLPIVAQAPFEGNKESGVFRV